MRIETISRICQISATVVWDIYSNDISESLNNCTTNYHTLLA